MIDQTVAGGARGPLHDVELGLLVGEGDGGHHVGEQVHGEDGQRGEWQRDFEDDPGLERSCVNQIERPKQPLTKKGRISGMLLVSV